MSVKKKPLRSVEDHWGCALLSVSWPSYELHHVITDFARVIVLWWC